MKIRPLHDRILVKRGLFQCFEDLHRAFASNGPADVIWDRRVRERRKAVKPTDADRRRAVGAEASGHPVGDHGRDRHQHRHRDERRARLGR